MSRLALPAVTFYCLITYAISSCNSQSDGSFVLQPINLGYASCPSCPRDCPDILSSPWYRLPATRDTRFIKSKENEYAPRVSSIASSPQRQTRNPWYGNVNPYERYIGSQSRNTTVKSQNTIPYQTRVHPWNQDVTYRPAKVQMDSGLNTDSMEYGANPKSLLNGYFRRDFNSMIDKEVGVLQDPTREVLVLYSVKEDEEKGKKSEENPYSIFGSWPLKEFSKRTKGSVYDKYEEDVSVNAPIQMEETSNVEISPELLDHLDQFHFPKLVSTTETLYSPEIKYNPYNLPADLNILRMIHNLEMPSQYPVEEEDNKSLVPRRSDNTNNMEADSGINQISFANNADVITKEESEDNRQVPQEIVDDSREEIKANEDTQEQVATNDKLMEEISRRSSAINEDTLSFAPNPDFVNDMVEPTLVSTEPTPTYSIMDTSTTV